MPTVALECDAVLFDMDGTLVDSRALVERMWLRWAGEHGIPPAAVLAVAHGRRTLDTMQLVAPELATPAEAERLDALEALEEGGETAIAGAPELLLALPRDRWAVVTSAGRALATTRIATVGLPAPSVLVGADDVAEGKPAPDGYLLAAERLGVTAARTVVFEDTPAGLAAGVAAGATAVGVLTTYPSLEGGAFVVADLRSVRVDPTSRDGTIRLLLDTGPSGGRPPDA